jgi:hypothetical protein
MTPDQDKFLNDLRHQALTATAAVESGFQAEKALDDGVSAESSAVVKQRLHEVALASAFAIGQYERNRDIITRQDGDHSLCVRIDISLFYKQLDEQGIPYVRIEQFREFNPNRIAEEMGYIQERMREVMTVRELLDCAVFPSRILIFALGQSVPRVMSFSRCYHALFATVRLLQQISKLPTNAQLLVAERGFVKRFHDEFVGKHTIERCGDGPYVLLDNESWRSMRTTKETINSFTSRHLKAARDDMLAAVRELGSWFTRETRYHNNQMGELEIGQTGFEPTFTREQFAQYPDCVAHRFYRELWQINEKFCIGWLHAYEGTILLFLQDYIPKETWEHWRTRDIYPVGKDSTPPVTVDEVLANNKKLGEWRKFDGDVRARTEIKDAMQSPSLRPELLLLPVERDQPWSPTFEQLVEFHRAQNTLFCLPAEEIENLFNRRNKELKETTDAVVEALEATRVGLDRISLSTVATPQDSVLHGTRPQKRKGK